MANRIESPSSINTFKQCPRKYYYTYVEKLPRGSSIHLVRGNIAHSTLEYFYDIDISKYTNDDFEKNFHQTIQKLLFNQWGEYKEKLDALHLSNDKLRFYFEETMMMVINWTNHFIKEFTEELKNNPAALEEVFHKVSPVREMEYKSEEHKVRGFIDAIAYKNNEVHIIDYKTNKKPQIKDSIKLQLAIYCMMYKEKHGKMPDKVGVFFLRNNLQMLKTTPEMVTRAKEEIELIHAHTGITELKTDYQRNITPLCKWKTGQCEFYEVCKPHS
ncbi:PD-(D/E)XK nuclease family protein [archaeon]|nr:PD-(D/E)XK nuclease family protein [archaeon]MBT6762158.1 PD-(D/E)XK nuclease family protein [archaeon]